MRFSLASLALMSSLLISCGVSKSFHNKSFSFEDESVLTTDLDLLGKDLILSKASTINLMGHVVRNGRIICNDKACFFEGRFENVTIISSESFEMRDCSVSNPNKRVFLYCPDEKRDYSISIKVRNCSFRDIGSATKQDGSTISAIYLQRVSEVLIEGCVFSNIGNENATKVSAILVGSSRMTNNKANKSIVVRDSKFSHLYKKALSTHDSGEGHFIMTIASEHVLIDNNQIFDHDLHGFDSEAIYTKSQNVVISNNLIESDCGGEGIIVCKPYELEGHPQLTHADIINNTIKGKAFAAITHYGVGDISGNIIENGNTGFLISIQKTSLDRSTWCTLSIKNNVFSSSCTSNKPLFTGNCRSVLYCNTLESSNQYINVLFEHNTLSVNNSLSGCIFNLRNASNVSWKISHNLIEVSQRLYPLVYFQNDGKMPRHDLSIDLRDNELYNISPIVLLPDNGADDMDSILLEINGNRAQDELIKDLSPKKSSKNRYIIKNNHKIE